MSPETVVVEATLEPLSAPSRMTSEHRLEFRRSVLEALERSVAAGDKTIDVDLSATVEIDASGLGVLVLLQKRARERGVRTRLLRAPNAVREMLKVTRLDGLFEFATAI